MTKNGADVVFQTWGTILVPFFLCLNCERKRRVFLQRLWQRPRTFTRHGIYPERALTTRVTIHRSFSNTLRLPMKLLPLLVFRRVRNFRLPIFPLCTLFSKGTNVMAAESPSSTTDCITQRYFHVIHDNTVKIRTKFGTYQQWSENVNHF